MDVDFSNFEREDFKIEGFFRALVEDNVDPLEAGRLRVRILGIHSMNALEAPTENLPWAEPVSSLAYSGGANLQNIDMKPGVSAIPKTKYAPSPLVPPLELQLPIPVPTDSVNQATTESLTIPEHRDTALCNSGSGGHFSVPAKGSIVWIFFDAGCHLRPLYFAMATQKRDWAAQKLKITGELVDRDAILSTITTKLTPGADASPHAFTGTATNPASISTGLVPPSIVPVGSNYGFSNRMENLTSWTSPGGTTILCNHTFGKEEMYIMHKGFSQFVDSKGQVYKVVGSTSPAPVTPVTAINPTNGAGLANDETEYNAGLKNIYVVGDYNLYTIGNCFIQCFQSIQINANANVGVVARTGNVNVLAQTGDINVESSVGNISMKGLKVQIEADDSIILKAKNIIDMNSLNSIQMAATTQILMDSSINAENSKSKIIKTSQFEVNADASSTINSLKITLDATNFNVNAKSNILLTSPIIESKADSLMNIQSANINIKGEAAVSVNASGIVNILGATLNAFGTGVAMIGGSQTTVGGAQTTVTGIVTLGVGTVAPAAPASPVTNVYATMPPTSLTPYTETPFTPSKPDIPIVATPSQQIT